MHRIKNVDGIVLNDLIFVDPNDKVGIGVSLPSEKLQINGAVIIGEHTLGSPLAGTIEWDGTNFRGFNGSVFINLDATAGAGSIGLPTDGNYGTDGQPEGEISGIASGDSVEDAFDKIESVLTLLAPTRPPNLSTLLIAVPNFYSALEHISGAPTNNITDDPTPTGTVGTSFYDASSGTLEFLVDTVSDGLITFTSADETGLTNGGLEILSETVLDNLWQQATAEMTTTVAFTPGVTVHDYQLTHSTTGSVNIGLSIDDPQVPPVISSQSALGVHTSGKKVSGVPTLSDTDTVDNSLLADDTVSYFYNSTRLVRVESAYVTDADVPYSQTLVQSTGVPISTTPPTRSDQIEIIAFSTTASSSVYIEDITLTYKAFTADSTVGSLGSGSTGIRIDTKSDETLRVKSGSGQFPAISLAGTTSTTNSTDCGSPYNSTESLELNEELQMLNTEFLFPPDSASSDYTGNLPTAGPDYSDLNTAHTTSYNELRWVTVNVGSIVNVNSFTFTISDVSGFTGTPIEGGGVEMYLIVDGDTGWLNANAAYPGAGSPSVNDDPALDAGSSTATSKRITFGPTVRSGTVYVRIGLPLGSGRKFKDII